jgi:hypothetical protein
MGGCSAVVSVQKGSEGWIWLISDEELLRHGRKTLEQSHRSFETYEAALADAQIIFNDLEN